MTDIQMEERSSKKKLLVPIVVLMLCAVSVIGAGYAYTTSVTNQNNTMAADYYTIDMYSNTTGTTVTAPFALSDSVHLYTEKVVKTNILVKAAVENANPLCYVGVKDSTAASNPTTATISPVVTISSTDSTGWATNGDNVLEYSINNAVVLSLTFTVGTQDTSGFYPVIVTVDAPGTNDVIATYDISTTEKAADAAASECITAINKLTYNLALSASKT